MAGRDASPTDRRGARSLHRGAGGRETGGGDRDPEPVAPDAGAREHPGRDYAVQYHHDRSHRGREDRGRAPPRAARGRPLPQGRGLQVHRGRLRRPRRGVDDPRAGGRVDHDGPYRAGGRRLAAGGGAGGGEVAGAPAPGASGRGWRQGTGKWGRSGAGAPSQGPGEAAAGVEGGEARRPRGGDRTHPAELPDAGVEPAPRGDAGSRLQHGGVAPGGCSPSRRSAAR